MSEPELTLPNGRTLQQYKPIKEMLLQSTGSSIVAPDDVATFFIMQESAARDGGFNLYVNGEAYALLEVWTGDWWSRESFFNSIRKAFPNPPGWAETWIAAQVMNPGSPHHGCMTDPNEDGIHLHDRDRVLAAVMAAHGSINYV